MVAEGLSQLSLDSVEVTAYRRGLLRVAEGLVAGDKWVYVEPECVRWRWRGSDEWHEVQPVQVAAEKIGAFMRNRPDLA